MSTFTLPGGTLKLVVGTWETRGLYEVWRCELEKRCRIEWDMPHPDWELYQITSGAVRFQVLNEEFVARAGELVRIPPYTRHKLEVLEPTTVIHDMGCQIRLLSLLEDYEAIQTRDPEMLEDPAARAAFLEKYNCFVTYFGL